MGEKSFNNLLAEEVSYERGDMMSKCVGREAGGNVKAVAGLRVQPAAGGQSLG